MMNPIFNQSEILWVEHVEEFVYCIKRNQFQIELGMKLAKNDVRFVDFFSQLMMQDVFAVKRF